MKRMARPKGKKFFPVTFTLTQEQIEYLNKQPNASEIIRKILDDLIQVGKDVEGKLEVVSLNKQLENLKERLTRLTEERVNHVLNNKSLWKTYTDDEGETTITYEGETTSWKGIPVPLNPEDENTKIALRILKGFDDALAALEQRINEVKQKILSM